MNSEGTLAAGADERKRDLDVRLAGGVAWTAGAKWITQVFSWASLVIVARKLSPADYGIAEMAGLFFALTNILAEFGVGNAVLHMPELEESALDQLHAFSLILCTGVYLLSVAASPLVARFFHNEKLIPLLAVNNLSFFITGFQAVPLGLLQRDMDYRRLSISEAVMYLVQAVVTVAAALLGLGYWSLVLGVLLGKGTNAVLVSVWKPLFFRYPRWKDIRAPLEFGRQAAIGGLAWSAYIHSDGIVVGRMLGDSTLGIYRMAMNLASAPAEKISMLIMRTAGPLFANLQSDMALARRYFLILSDTLSLVVVPAMVGLILVAPEAIRVVLGAKWLPAATPMAWLAVYMIVTTMNTLIGQVLVSQRQTQFTMRMSLLNCVVMPVALVAGAYWRGMSGAAAAWVIASPVTVVPMSIKLFKRIELGWGDFFLSLWPILASAAVMGIALAGVRSSISPLDWPLAAKLAIEVAAGAAFYLLVFVVFFREKLARYFRFLTSLRGGKLRAAA